MSPRRTAAVALLALATLLTGCGTGPKAPALGVTNDSSTWLRVSVWIPDASGGFSPGRSVVVGPGAALNLRPADLPPAPPVRIEVEAIGPVVRWARPAWLQIADGGPHRLQAGGQERELWLTPTPESSWSALTRDTAAVLRRPEDAQPDEAPDADAWMPTLGPETPLTPDNPRPAGPVSGPRSRF